MSVAQIAEVLRANVQNGLLALKDSTVAEVPLGSLLSLLNARELNFLGVTITTTENSVTVTGSSALLGAADIALEASFTDNGGTITFSLSAKQIPACQIPGASWLALYDAQLALQVVGQADAVLGTISGTVRVGETAISTVLIVGKQDREAILQWTIATIDLTAITQTFLDGAALPPDMPVVAFKDVETVIKPQSGYFSFKAMTAQALNFPATGNGFSITETSIELSRTVVTDGQVASSQIRCAIALRGDRPFAIANEFTLNRYNLEFNLEGKDWKLAGDVEAELFDHTVALAASYEQTVTERHLQLSLTTDPAVKVVDLGSAGYFSLSYLALDLIKQATTEPHTAATTAWEVKTRSTVVFTDVAELSGELRLYKDLEGNAGLVFAPERAHVHLMLPPTQKATMSLEFGEISILRQSGVDTATGRSQWRFAAAVDVSFQGWHPTVHQYLPETIKTTFKADHEGVTLTADRVLNPFDFVIPDLEISDSAKVELGAASIDVSDLLIRLGKSIEIGAEMGIGLPSKLNNLFGVETNGKPSIEFFNTFNPADRENTVIKARLSIGTSGIKIAPTSSIIRAIEVVEENGESWWYCKLGENGAYGEVKFKVPTFSYNAANSSFMASGAFETIKPLALPLTPAKLLLSACKLQGAANALPQSLPLKNINIVDNQGNFNVDAFLAELKSFDIDLPDEIDDMIRAIAKHLDKLPDRFKQYLNIEIPRSFAFDLGVTPSGTVRFDARVKEGDPPIKLFFPGMLGPIPVLNGVELHSISFGEFAGGSLFLLQLDAVVDQFDLATLAASVALPEIPNNPLPSSRSLHRRLVMDKLFMVIVYQTGIPIPIPLFYNEMGLEYLGLEGLQLGAHAQFPMPTLDLVEAGKLLSSFKQFFTDRNYLLDPNAAPQNMNLVFSLKENFLELPTYLGGKLLGDKVSGPEINAYKSLASLLNGMKTLSVNQLVQMLPLENRVGNTAVSFGPIAGELSWLATTPDEYRTLVPQRLGLPLQQAQTVLQLAVPNGSNNEQGLMVFLKGNCAIANLANFDTVFGLAAADSVGFHTGFRMAASISNVMSMEIAGRVAVNGKANPSFQLAGQSHLTFQNRRIFQGDVQIADQRFRCAGMLDLYGLGGSVAVEIDRNTGATIQGEVNPINLSIFKLSGAQGKPKPSVFLQIRPNTMPVLDISGAVELLGLRSETRITVADNSFSFTTVGSLFNRFSCTLQASGQQLTSTANFRVAATMQNDLFRFLKTEATQVIKQEADRATASISAAQRDVDKAQSEVNRLNQVVTEQRRIVQGERSTAESKLRSAEQDVEAAQRKVNQLNNDIRSREQEIDRIRNQSCTKKFGTWWCPPKASAKIAELGLEIAGLYTALGTATGALKTAQGALILARQGVNTTPIDADPRVAGPLASLKIATGVLDTAKQFLEVTKSGVRAGASASDYILRHGLDALLQVNAASFVADLQAASGGQVVLSINLTYQGRTSTLSVNFNFNNPVAGARELAQMLLQQ